MEATVCDTCGEEDGTIPRGDLAICGPCARGERKDSRPHCPSCGQRVPHSFLFALEDKESIFAWDKQCHACGYQWDERVEGDYAGLWKAMGIVPKA